MADDDLIGGVEMHFPKYVSCSFTPRGDITAFELASLLPFFHGKHMTENDWALLGVMQRHFTRHGD